MASAPAASRQRGFSMVEMLIALLFVLILMAGMSSVFKSTLTTFTASGEKVGSARRNRMSLDLLYDDLNTAGMYLLNLATPQTFSSTNGGFYINPDPLAQAGTPIPGVTQGADELYFFLDDPLPFEGTLSSSPAKGASTLAMSGLAPTTNDFTYTIKCPSSTYASQIAAGQGVFFKDDGTSGYISSVTTSGQNATIVLGASPSAGISDTTYAGTPSKYPHIVANGANPGAGIVFVNPNMQVKYSLQQLNLDPMNSAAATVCLVRDEGTYNATGFTATVPREVITENVSGFRVYLSADAGQTWIGGTGYANWAAITTALNTSLANSGRSGFTSISTDTNWFRSTPVLVRVDVTTRTARQRTEFSTTGNALAYKEQVQSLVLVPRHFGLPLN